MNSRTLFRFTIRDVLWLTVVVAMGVAWWRDHKQLLSRTKQNIELMACESLLGQSRDQIVELLGRPEGRIQGDRWLYFAGTRKEVHALWLEVVFYNDTVASAAFRTFPRTTPTPPPANPPAGPPPPPSKTSLPVVKMR